MGPEVGDGLNGRRVGGIYGHIVRGVVGQKLLGLVCRYGQGKEFGVEVRCRGAESVGLVVDFLTGVEEDDNAGRLSSRCQLDLDPRAKMVR